jgi:predicted ATPase
MAEQVAGGKGLPTEIVQQLVDKTDGVPLYVEEMTKAVLESVVLKETNGHYELAGSLASLSIPATLQDSLMARLDRLVTAKGVAQYASVIGRQFSYALLQAVSALDEATLQQELGRLVDAELIYQRGLPPQATYTFKHALIQDTAYESLLRSARQGYHRRIAETLTERFPDTAETQPELVAYHFTEAACAEQAAVYWLRAGQAASAYSAYAEAIDHLTRGLQVLGTLPDSEARRRQELDFQEALGTAFRLSKGFSSPEAGQAFARAHELCDQVGDTPQLGPVLHGLWAFYATRASFQRALEVEEQLLALGERQADAMVQHHAHSYISAVRFYRGEHVRAQTHLDQAIALYDPQYQDRAFELRYGSIYGSGGYHWSAWNLWVLGYPQQAWKQVHTAFELTQASNHRHGRITNLYFIVQLHEFCRQAPAAWEQADQTIALANELGAVQWAAWATCVRGWALAAQDQPEEGIAQLHQGLEALESLDVEILKPWFLAKLGEAYGIASRPEEGLRYIDQGLDLIETTEQCFGATELYRLRGYLSLLISAAHYLEAEADFHQALDITRHQQAKSLELRAASSLAKLWQSQGRRQDAYDLLAPVYGWFIEGFDTADLRDAKALLDELA